ncbi:hypothetical protein [Otariodibacter sp.]|uniref:hypothetical protein n=1 Tax=Otariodibacter sp. TaxID=3030919 RepID=UPI0026175537|nr:hypothetical protein [Otariodibacter sp.]
MLKRLLNINISKTMNVPIQVGISENDHYHCIVYIHEGSIVNFWRDKSKSLASILVDIQNNEPLLKSKKLTIIRPVSHHYIWRKYVFLPYHYSDAMCYKKIIEILKTELPVSLDDVFFDYYLERNKSTSAIRIIIYALRKEFSKSLLTNKRTILDCELYCYLRAFHYLSTFPYDMVHKNYYKFRNYIIQFQLDKLLIQENNDALNVLTIEHINNKFKHILDTDIYLLALGACLWNGKV